ncbi:MEthylTransferase Like [Trichostrongylus colubriformis]|uniref:Methyltransferase-like protein 5 n=1 Tax=Trichostrongylus colubriformis TaxID=6319 RepID=A0AAN8F4D4_TRICO
MKPKRMEWILSDLRTFENPNVKLEQYATSPELAISIVDSIDRLVGLDGRFVADLGCGCGMLMSTVVLAHQPAAVVGIDIDEYALSICKGNLEEIEMDHCCHLIKGDVLQLANSLRCRFDVVIMNPPFGTKKNEGTDMRFVRAGLMMLPPGGSLFSLHKSSTRDYILKTANKWDDVDACCIAQLRWNLESTYKFHKKKSVDIAVDLIHYKKV